MNCAAVGARPRLGQWGHSNKRLDSDWPEQRQTVTRTRRRKRGTNHEAGALSLAERQPIRNDAGSVEPITGQKPSH